MAVFYTVFYSLIRLTSLPVTSNIIRYFTDGGMIVCSLFFLMVWISQPHVKILEKIVGLIMVAVACLLLVTYHYRILLELSFLLSTRSKVLFDDILERIVKYSLIVFCLIFFCSLLGITKNVEYARNDMYEVETNFKALSFGFFYYSAPAYLFMNIIVSSLYLTKGNCSLSKFIFLVILAFLVFFLCVTRVQLLVNIIMFIAFLLIYKTRWNFFSGKKWIPVALFSYPLMALFVFYIFSDKQFIDRDLLIFLNLIFNGRLSFNQEAFEKFDITWCGNEVETSMGTAVDEYFFIDCGYIDVLMRYGFIITSFILLSFSIAFYRIYKARESFLFAYMMLFVLVSFVNNFFFASQFFPYALLLGCSFTKRELNRKTIVTS